MRAATRPVRAPLSSPCRGTRLASWVGLIAFSLFGPGAGAEEDKPWQDGTAALQIEVKTKKGVHYSGRIGRTAASEKLFPGERAPELGEVDPTTKISIVGFNGLSGSIGLKIGELASLSVVGPLDTQAIESQKDKRSAARESKWAKERERLAKIDAMRKARAQAALAAAAEAPGELPELSEAASIWMNRYPPEEGWVPAKKAELYYQTVILNTRPMTDAERDWTDNYDAWKLAYDEWLALEQARFELEQAAATAGGAPVDPGASGATSQSSAAGVDPGADGQGGAGLPKVDPLEAGQPKAEPVGGDDLPKVEPLGGDVPAIDPAGGGATIGGASGG